MKSKAPEEGWLIFCQGRDSYEMRFPSGTKLKRALRNSAVKTDAVSTQYCF